MERFSVGQVVYFDEAEGEIIALFEDMRPACARVVWANGYISEEWLSDLMTAAEYKAYEREMSVG